MNESQRRRKKSDEWSAISKTNLEFIKIFYRLYELFIFITHDVNIL